MRERWHIPFLLFLAVLVLGYYLWIELETTGGQIGAPLDDAWIHYQFARNLSQGNGFSYIPGVPTPGSTSPAWTLLMAGVGLFTQQYLWPSIVLSASFFLLTTYLTFRLAVEFTDNKWVGVIASIGVLSTGRMLWSGLSAMEVTLFASLCLGAVLSYHHQGLKPFTAALFGLASLARPEGHILFGLALFDTVFAAPNVLAGFRANWRKVLIPILIYGLIMLPYSLFSLSVTGRPLPNTFYAKSDSITSYSWRALEETLRLHWRDNPFSLVLLPFGLIYLWTRNRLVGAWWIGLVLLVPFIVPFIWHHGRYTMPLIPFQMVLAAAGIYWLNQKFRVNRNSFLVLGAFVIALPGAWGLPHWATMLGNNVREIQEIDVAMGQWIAENIPADEIVAIDDIGVIVFLSPREIVDLNGLVSPEMWPVMEDDDFNTAAAHLLAKAGVTYMAVFPSWHRGLVDNPDMARPIQRFSTDTHTIIGEQEAVVYEMDWPYRSSIDPEFERIAQLGDVIILHGYDYAASTDTSRVSLTLYWESIAATMTSYKVFVHILNEDGGIVAQIDQIPANGAAPTYRWQPGDLVRDPHQIELPPDLPAGNYFLMVGLYTEADGRLRVEGKDIENNAVWLTDWELRQ